MVDFYQARAIASFMNANYSNQNKLKGSYIVFWLYQIFTFFFKFGWPFTAGIYW